MTSQQKIYSKKSWHYRLVQWFFDGIFDNRGHVTVSLVSYIFRIIAIIFGAFFVIVWYPLIKHFSDDTSERTIIEDCEVLGAIYVITGLIGSSLYSALHMALNSAPVNTQTEIIFVEMTLSLLAMAPLVIYGFAALVLVVVVIVDGATTVKITFDGDSP